MEKLAEKAKTISNVYFIKTKQPTPHNENRPFHSIYLGSGPKLEWRQHINRGFITGQCGVTFSHRAALFLSPQLGPSWEPAAFQLCLQTALCSTHQFLSEVWVWASCRQRFRFHMHTLRVWRARGGTENTKTPKNQTALVLPEEYVRDNFHIKEAFRERYAFKEEGKVTTRLLL